MSRPQERNSLQAPVSNRDHVQGPDSAAVTLVEYGDYECPYCGSAYPIVKQLQERLGERLRFVFRNFPLSEMHQHAEEAAEAAEAAGGQGMFWEMHDLLYENQGHLEEEHLEQYATELELNREKFDRDVSGHAYAGRIEEDLQSGDKSGIPGTPAFFINGSLHEGSFDFDTMLAAIERAKERL